MKDRIPVLSVQLPSKHKAIYTNIVDQEHML